MKAGNKLICKKKKLFFFSKDKNLSFTDGKVYEIQDLNKDGIEEKYYSENTITGCREFAFSMPKISILYIVDDQCYMRFLDFIDMNIFLTQSELRKEKLQKITK